MDCAAEEQLVRMALVDLDAIEQIEVDLDRRDVLVAHHGDPIEIGVALETLGLGAHHIDDDAELVGPPDPGRERGALLFSLAVNAAFFVGELSVGLISRSMGLVADALDMGADAGVYALSLAAVGSATVRKKQLARISGFFQFGLAALGLAEVVRRFVASTERPEPLAMIVLSLLALAGNIAVLVVLRRVRSGEAHLQASWIFTANDIKVNLLVIAAAIGVILTDSAVPDLVAGAVIFVVVANGARRILNISR